MQLQANALTFEKKLENNAEEVRANHLFKEIRCMVCTSEAIHESKTELAQDMRQLVRTKISEGLTNEQIKQYLVERYGYEILMSPPLAPLTYFLWLAPLIAIITGLLFLFIIIKKRK
jgi:cytochrome c-type biogenesis protein CcmH